MKEGGKRERKQDRDSIPKGCNDQSWARLKPGVRDSFQVFYEGAEAQGLEPSSAVTSRPFQGAGLKTDQSEFEPALLWETSITGGNLTWFITTPSHILIDYVCPSSNAIII